MIGNLAGPQAPLSEYADNADLALEKAADCFKIYSCLRLWCNG